MRTLLTAVSILALSGSLALAQTPAPPTPESGPAGTEVTPPPPPGDEQPGDDMPQSGPDAGGGEYGTSDMERREGSRHGMRGGGPRHEMRGSGHRGGHHWRAMRGMGSEFSIEIDDDGGVKVEVKCGPREEARACADIATELLERALGN